MGNKALILGVTGQDGSILADKLLADKYEVYGVARRTSTPSDKNIKEALKSPNFHLVSGDITDFASMQEVISTTLPDELYLLAAQSHVGESFKTPLSTWDITGKGVLNVLEAVKQSSPTTKVVFAASSEMFGNNAGPDGFISEHTPFNPQSPYAIAKCAGYYAVQLYRSYGLFCCNCIAFNHESERRGENFVTRKITKYIRNNINEIILKEAPLQKLKLGNLSAYRDWSYAGDIVDGMRLMFQQVSPDDYILASGKTHSVEEFLKEAFGLFGVNHKDYVEIDPDLFRPAEVHMLLGNSGKARSILGWKPTLDFKGLVKHMVDRDCPGWKDLKIGIHGVYNGFIDTLPMIGLETPKFIGDGIFKSRFTFWDHA
jgi:GDPmannose 4,6-dehydratase